jgi:hypothetical protein
MKPSIKQLTVKDFAFVDVLWWTQIRGHIGMDVYSMPQPTSFLLELKASHLKWVANLVDGRSIKHQI